MPLTGEIRKVGEVFSEIYDGENWVLVHSDEELRLRMILAEERELTRQAIREEFEKFKREQNGTEEKT